MNVEITYNGQPLHVGVLEFEVDIPETINQEAINTNWQTGEQTLTLDGEYFKAIMLANMLQRHSPKKAKQIRTIAERRNPLRIMGLLPNA